MDFKICGTAKGVTGFQLDLKLPGIPLELMAEAIIAARDARMQVLDVMERVLAAPRNELSTVRPAHRDDQDQPGQDRRAHRAWRQEHQGHRRRDRRRDQHRGRRHRAHLLEQRRQPSRRAKRDHQRHDQGNRGRRDLPAARVVSIKEFGASSKSCPARTASSTSPSWPTSA